MGFDQLESTTHETESTAPTAPQGATSGALGQLAARGQLTPEAIALRIMHEPQQRDAILLQLNNTHGSSFVQAVVSSAHAARAPQVAQASDSKKARHEASNQASYVALRVSLQAFAAELRDAGTEARDAPNKPKTEAGNEPVLDGMEHTCDRLYAHAVQIEKLARAVELDDAGIKQMPIELELVNRAAYWYASELEKARGLSTRERPFNPNTKRIDDVIDLLHNEWGLNRDDLRGGDLRAVGDAVKLEAAALDAQIAAAHTAMTSVRGGNADIGRVVAHLAALHDELIAADVPTLRHYSKRVSKLLHDAATLNVSTPKLVAQIDAFKGLVP